MFFVIKTRGLMLRSLYLYSVLLFITSFSIPLFAMDLSGKSRAQLEHEHDQLARRVREVEADTSITSDERKRAMSDLIIEIHPYIRLMLRPTPVFDEHRGLSIFTRPLLNLIGRCGRR